MSKEPPKKMIEARQYNIGNIVYVDNEKYHPKLKNIPLEITSISECIGLDNKKTYNIRLKHINQLPNAFYETYSQFIKFIKPIELTEDLLLKCGFDEYLSPYDLRISICNGVLLQFHFGVNQIECWIGDEISRTDIKYLHQLQNLYYALTGQELEITL